MSEDKSKNDSPEMENADAAETPEEQNTQTWEEPVPELSETDKLKAELAAERDDFFTDFFDYGFQLVRSKVSAYGVADILVCSRGHKLAENEHFIPVGSAVFQLTVGECAGSALTKLDIALAVKDAKGIEAVYSHFPLVHGATALDYYWAPTRYGKGEGCEKSCGACADD